MQLTARTAPPPQDPIPDRRVCDPVSLEIIRGAIAAAQSEMEALLERTAISAFIREKKDFYTALFDENGVMAVGSMVPIFGDMTSPVFDHFPADTMKPGDLYWYNDCYGSRGAVSHSNDQVLLAPVFKDGKRCAFVMSWAHFADIGGMRPGSISPDATDIFQEGIIVPPTKLIDQGVTNEAALAIFGPAIVAVVLAGDGDEVGQLAPSCDHLLHGQAFLAVVGAPSHAGGSCSGSCAGSSLAKRAAAYAPAPML